MVKLVRIRWRNIMLLFLGLMGFLALIIDWSSISGQISGFEDRSAPAATLVDETAGDITAGKENEQISPVTANVIEMPGDIAAAGYFVDYRLDRQRSRGQTLEYLREIVNNPSSDPEIRNEAQRSIMAISNNISLETELENLIKAKGFEEAIVSLKEGSANVVVKSDSLTTEEAARICDLVARGTGITEQNIVIIPKR